VIYGGTGGNDNDVLNLVGTGAFQIVNETTDADGDSTSGTVEFLDDNGVVTGTLDFYEIERIVPCFTPGTLIATTTGEKPVEDLQVGDSVITRDNGLQEIAWYGSKSMTGAELVKNQNLKPVLIRAGSLGKGLPKRDMMVSPNHRMLIANDKTQLYFEEREVLVAAKHLIGMDGVHVVDVPQTNYIHFMFERHEVVLADGSWSESFQPGDQSLKGIGNAQRKEIFSIFPELSETKGQEEFQSARRSLKKHEARLLVK